MRQELFPFLRGVVLLTLLIALAACGGAATQPAPEDTAPPAEQPTEAMEATEAPQPTDTPEESAAADEETGGEPLKVGAIQPISGPLATLGNQALDGMNLAVELVNDEGGVNGRPVELVVADAPAVEDARSQAERLVREEQIPVVAGTYGSSLAISSATATTRFGGFYWEVSSASTDITSQSAPYSMKMPWTVGDLVNDTIGFVDGFFAPKIGKDPQDVRVALIHEDTAYGSGVATLMEPAFEEAGLGALVTVEPYTAESIQDFTPIISRLKDADVDIVFAASYLNDAQLFIRQAAEQGLEVSAIVGLTAGFADTGLPDNLPNELLDGIYVTDSKVDLDAGLTEDGQRLRGEMLDRFADMHDADIPPSHTAYSFLGTYTLLRHTLDGIEDPSDRDAILSKAEALDLPLGSLPMGFGVKFGPVDDPEHPHVNLRTLIVLNQWQNGSLVSVGPDEFAEAEPVEWNAGN